MAEAKKAPIPLRVLKIEYVQHGSIKGNSYNPNRQDQRAFSLLCKSIKEDGFTQPIVVHRPTMEIVDGEHRWRAAKELGIDPVPVVFVEMTAEQMRIATLRHNRARGSEDVELTAQVMRDLADLGATDWAASSLMISKDEIDEMVNNISVPELLASKEYSNAWRPEKGYEDKEGGRQVTDESEDVREAEKRIAEAKTEEEREKRKAEANFFRVVLTYVGEDAEVARVVLAEHPANTVLEAIKPLYPEMKKKRDEDEASKKEEKKEARKAAKAK